MRTENSIERDLALLREGLWTAEAAVAKAKRQRDLLHAELWDAEILQYEVQFNGVDCDSDGCLDRMLRSEAIEINHEFFCDACCAEER